MSVVVLITNVVTLS